jgi:hypothetical protein
MAEGKQINTTKFYKKKSAILFKPKTNVRLLLANQFTQPTLLEF